MDSSASVRGSGASCSCSTSSCWNASDLTRKSRVLAEASYCTCLGNLSAKASHDACSSMCAGASWLPDMASSKSALHAPLQVLAPSDLGRLRRVHYCAGPQQLACVTVALNFHPGGGCRVCLEVTFETQAAKRMHHLGPGHYSRPPPHQKLTEMDAVSARTWCHQPGGMYNISPGCKCT